MKKLNNYCGLIKSEKKRFHRRRHAWEVLAWEALFILTPSVAFATDYTVANSTDLTNAINSINAGSGGDTITLQGNITLSSLLPALNESVTVEGQNYSISGNNSYNIFTVAGGQLTVVNASLINGTAVGSNGTAGQNYSPGVGGASSLLQGSLGTGGTGGYGGIASYSNINGGSSGGYGSFGGGSGGAGGQSGYYVVYSSGKNAPPPYSVPTYGGGGGGGGGLGAGGAVVLNGGTANFQDVSFNNNSAIGGNGGAGGPPTYATTGQNGTSGSSGVGGAGWGGAIFVYSGSTMSLTDGSFSGNTVAGGSGGSVGASAGQDVYLLGGTLNYTVDSGSVSANIASNVTWSALNKFGTGTLVLTATGTNYFDTLSVNGGTLSNGASGVLANSYVNIGSSGTLALNASDSIYAIEGSGAINLNGYNLSITSANGTVFSGQITGSGGLALTGGTQTLSGANNYSGGTTLAGGILQAGSATALGTGSISFTGGTLQYGSGITQDYSSQFSTAAGQLYSINTNGQAVTLATALTSSGGSLTKLGAGTLSLTGTNTYSGGTTLENGTLALGNSSAIGTGALTTIDPTVVYSNGVTIANPIIMEGATTLEVDNSDSATQQGVISESGGSYGVSKTGTGTLTLTGTNTYTGAMTISAGTLAIGSGGGIAISSGIDLAASGATFDISNGGSQTIQDLSGASGSTVNLGGNELRVGTANSTEFDGVIQGSGGSLVKQGAGTLTLGGNNTYSGSYTSIEAGTLVATNNHAFSNTTVYVGNGDTTGIAAALLLGGSSGGVNVSNTVSVNPGTGTNRTVGGINTSGTDTFSGLVQMDGYTWENRSMNVTAAAGGTVAFTNTISGSGQSVTKIGAGTVVFGGSNTYSGGTTLASGILQADNATAFGTSTISFTGGTLQYGSGITQDYSSQFSTAAGQLYSINTNGQAVTLATALTSSGGSLTKLGAGTLTLTAANNYSGNTIIDSGTLAVSGTGASLSSSSNPIVYAGYNSGDNGTLLISNGGQINNGAGFLGYNASSSGTATVTGVNNGTASTWSTGVLDVGHNGTGTLNVENGGQATDFFGYIGNAPGSSGTATVTGVNGTTASTWSNVLSLLVGLEGAGTLNIENGGQVNDSGATLGADTGSMGTATVTSVNNGVASTWTNSNALTVGSSGTGTLNIENGGQVNDTDGYIGTQQNGNGTVTVTGINANGLASTWSSSSNLYVGYGGVGNGGDSTGALNIQDGGQVTDNHGSIGDVAGSNGTVTVSGVNANGTASRWITSAELYVGNNGTGTLNIQNGGQVTDTNAYIGTQPGSNGTATVTGISGSTASAWNSTGFLAVGYLGSGTLNIEEGGVVSSPTVILADINNAGGTLNLDSNGVLETGSLVNNFGAGGAAVNFNGGILRATANNSNFIANFSPGEVTLQGGGGTIDSNGYSITVNTTLGGTGGLTKAGAGTLTLTGANTYSGATLVSQGTLALSGNGSLGDSPSITIASGAVLDVSSSNSGTFTQNAAGTLAGEGTLVGNANISGIIEAGNTGLNISGNLTLNSTATLKFDLGSVNVQGNVALGNADLALNVAFINDPVTYGTELTLLTYTGTETGFFDYNGTALQNGSTFKDGVNTFQIDYLAGDPSIILTSETVPEPSTYALLLGGLGVLVCWRHRTHRTQV